jgi:hypothetical protein
MPRPCNARKVQEGESGRREDDAAAFDEETEEEGEGEGKEGRQPAWSRSRNIYPRNLRAYTQHSCMLCGSTLQKISP